MITMLEGRPKTGGLPVPYACEDDDGVLNHSIVVRKRAIRCGLSRICGICGASLSRPIAFLGPRGEWDAGLFTFPPTHITCAREALDLFVPIGGSHLGQSEAPLQWALVTTGGFELIRPSRRGGVVQFRPNSVIEAVIRD